MERRPQEFNGGEHDYHTTRADTHAEQEQIEQARNEATEQRRRDRVRLERYVEAGVSPDDAEALIDVQHSLRAQRGGPEPGGSSPEQASGGESAPRPGPRIYVASLSDYNAGEPHGAWIDAHQDPEELEAEVVRMLAVSPTPGAEEYAIHDYDGFFGIQIHEYENLGTVSRLAKGIARHGTAFAVLVEHKGLDNLDGLDEAMRRGYHGVCNSIEEFVDGIAEDMDVERFINGLPEIYRPYVRFDRNRLIDDVKVRLLFLEDANGSLHVFDRTVI
jgi:Antirestriction protein